MPHRPPLVLVPQHFGSLVFDRRDSRYYPFDAEATALLLRLHAQPIDVVSASIADVAERQAAAAFIECYYRQGYFGLDGRLAATVLPVEVPPDHLVGPLAVHLEIVAACNLRCSHCFAGELPRRGQALTLEQLRRLFGELASLGSFRLGLTGGEPLLRRDLLDLLDAATDAGLHPCLTTNALLLDEDMARELGRRPLVWLNVSLEGPDAQTNDRIRGAGTFERVCERLALLRRHGRFTLAFTLMAHNVHLAPQCAELAYAVGAHTAVFRPLYPAGIALEHLELMPSFAQYSGALQALAELESPEVDLHGLDPFSPQSREPTAANVHISHTCGAGQHVCSISVEGNVNPCSFLGSEFETGNILDRPFAEIWRQGQAMQRMRRPSPEGGFQGGCRARSLVLAGSVDAADPWMNAFNGCAQAIHPGGNVEIHTRRSLPLLNVGEGC